MTTTRSIDPCVDADLAQVFRRYSARMLLEQFRDHCKREADAAITDGWDGMGWLELYDQIADAVPTGTDESLCGEALPPTGRPITSLLSWSRG